VCSPFLLEGTLKFHLKNENSLVAAKIVENLYVDNAKSVDEAHQLFTESRNIFRKVSMSGFPTPKNFLIVYLMVRR